MIRTSQCSRRTTSVDPGGAGTLIIVIINLTFILAHLVVQLWSPIGVLNQHGVGVHYLFVYVLEECLLAYLLSLISQLRELLPYLLLVHLLHITEVRNYTNHSFSYYSSGWRNSPRASRSWTASSASSLGSTAPEPHWEGAPCTCSTPSRAARHCECARELRSATSRGSLRLPALISYLQTIACFKLLIYLQEYMRV
jgi:hypothetical protein